MNIVSMVLGLFSKTDIGAKVGGGISAIAILAALGPVALWLTKHSNDVFIVSEITYGEAAIGGAVLSVIIAIARGTRAG